MNRAANPDQPEHPPVSGEEYTSSTSKDNKKKTNLSKRIDKLTFFKKHSETLEKRTRFSQKRTVFGFLFFCLCVLFACGLFLILRGDSSSGVILLITFFVLLGIVIAFFISDNQEEEHPVLGFVSDILDKILGRR